MNVYEMEGFLRGKCLPGDLLVGESHAAYLVRKLNESATLKAERGAQQKRADALAVENAALKESASDLRRQAFNGHRNSHNCGPFQYSDLCESIIEATKVKTPATDAALAAIEARGVEKFVTKIAERLRTAGGEDGYSLVHWGEYADHLEDKGEEYAKQLHPELFNKPEVRDGQ